MTAPENFVQPDIRPGSAGSQPEAEVPSSLPVDPLRLLAGLWKRRTGLICAMVAGVLLGAGLGLFKTQTRYKASVQLIKRDLPSSFRVGEAGEPFKPRQLSNGTLVGTASANEVLEKVAAKASVPVSQVRGAIEVTEQRNTDFVLLAFSGFKSPEDTAATANLWAREVVQFTRDLQSQESREIGQFLQTQVDATDAELAKIRAQVLAFTKREDIVDTDKQLTTYLQSVSAVDLKYQTARISLDTLHFKIKGIEAELRRQSPLSDKLRSAQAELEDSRSQYTDKNPLIVEKIAKIKALQEQLRQASENMQADLSSYAGTTLGNTLYLDLVQCQNEAKAMESEVAAYDKLRTQERDKLNSIPEKAAAFAQLGLRKQSLEVARNLLFSRLREAQLFEENSPGYYRIFSPATAERVETRTKASKTMLFTAGCGILFALFGVTTALGLELLDPKLRTPWEAAKVFHAPLFGSIPNAEPSALLGSELWANWVGATRNPVLPRVVWSPHPDESEHRFWELLFGRAAMLLPALRVIDCGSPALPPSLHKKVCIERVDVTRCSISDAQQLCQKIQDTCRSGVEVWIRLAGPVHEPLTTIGRCGLPALVLVPLHVATTEFWKMQAELLAKTISQPAGVVSVGEIPWRQWE